MKIELIVEHYQKTFELTMRTWEIRNRTFLIILGVVGIGTLITWNVPESQPILVDFLMKLLGITNEERAIELRSSLPYGLLQSILLIVVAYLTLILYHRTATIQRFYKYLAKLEEEIRTGMSLSGSDVSFTRESGFYDKHKPKLGFFVAISYILMLGGLLAAFLGYRIYSDFSSGATSVGIVDSILATPTVMFYIGYMISSIS